MRLVNSFSLSSNWFLLFGFPQVRIDADIVLALVFAEVENLKSAVVIAIGFQLTLDADHSFTRGVDGELAEVRGYPLALKFFGNGGSGAGATEEVGDEIAFV